MTKKNKLSADDLRVRFTLDTDTRFEECNGEARPLTESEYAENCVRGCPLHPRSHVPPKRTDAGRAWCGVCGTEYADVSYPEYLAYYGNPDRHVYIGCIVSVRCRCCGQSDDTESLWGIDFMDDSPEYLAVTLDVSYTVAEVLRLPGYAAEVARDLIVEAGYCPREWRCTRRGCKFLCVMGTRFCAQHGGEK